MNSRSVTAGEGGGSQRNHLHRVPVVIIGVEPYFFLPTIRERRMATTPIEWAALFLIVVVPVLGITARVGIKPMVDAIVRLRESFADSGQDGLLGRRVAQLGGEVQSLRTEVVRLREAEAFQRSLLQSSGELQELSAEAPVEQHRPTTVLSRSSHA